MSSKSSEFRWDVQGLRALAVLAVLVFHVNPRLLPGGYLGVDIFFVISGYLIIGFIHRDLLQNKFKLLDFFSRRVKRLFPALFFMIFVVAIGVYQYMLPVETTRFAESMMSSLLYISNFYFYSQSDYFNTELHFSPLLHTWSLSVEEQFYIFFPILLLFLHSLKVKRFLTILFVFTLLGLFLSEILLRYDPSMSFYFSPSRFWQFSAGGLLSLSPQYQKGIKKSIFFDGIGFLALIVLLLCFYLYDGYVLFPGFNAIVPTIATLLIIWSGGSKGLVYKLLSIQPAKFFGNISYSLYLWHWPVIVFYKLVVSYSISKVDQFIIVVVSIVFGFVSYRLIEIPFKNYKLAEGIHRPIIFTVSLSALACIVAILMQSGLGYRFNDQQLRYSSYLDYEPGIHTRAGVCFLTSANSSYLEFNEDACVNYNENNKNILLIGDSHASHWYSALNELKKENESISQVNSSGCKPTLEYKGRQACVDLMRWAIENLIPETRFNEIVISARWTEKDLDYLVNTIDTLKNYTDKIVVLGPVVEYEVSLPRLLASANSIESISKLRIYNKIKGRDDLFRSKLKDSLITYVSILDVICPSSETCKVLTKNDIPFQFDYGHLTHEGALELLSEVKADL